ncbi:MAG: bifunctional hexulose-6-phosphate synthase/ribonuclease regulator [Candidatus Omnitrophota bacterium]|nr:MAG: bifunctional hexulose-6-phosphate synthase/ribonuclease regulator [Candidatus Omnitrophota bacterium]HDN97840.1 bifunctional hexulose-6-phosphate synthase/ribonuclease regulator [bacterium]
MEPVIQLALDFVDFPRALKVAREAYECGIRWIEAGTPLIKSCGIESVRILRKEFPDAKIIADMKVMDTGRVEAEIGFKAGADIVVVMGNSSDQTIKEAVEAAENYGGEIMVDLMEESANIKRAKEVEKLGINYIGVHIPIDEQMTGNISFSFLKEVVKNVKVPVAIAGGLNSENIVDAVKAGASILIVGGAITKSENVKEAVENLKKAIKTKVPVPTVLYKRVKEKEVRKVFEIVSTANISDALHRKGWISGILPVVENVKMAGPAITVRTYPGDWAKPVEAVDIAKEGDVIVIDAGGVGPAVWGELATNSCVIKKVAGVVIYGAIRDIEEIRKMKFPAFAKLITPQAGEPKGFGEINIPVRIGNQIVNPGDWIVGDSDGVVVIPKDKVVEIANRSMDVFEKENRIRKEIKEGRTLSDITEILKWEKPK